MNEQIRILTDALKFYANSDNWNNTCEDCRDAMDFGEDGETARHALAEAEKEELLQHALKRGNLR